MWCRVVRRYARHLRHDNGHDGLLLLLPSPSRARSGIRGRRSQEWLVARTSRKTDCLRRSRCTFPDDTLELTEMPRPYCDVQFAAYTVRYGRSQYGTNTVRCRRNIVFHVVPCHPVLYLANHGIFGSLRYCSMVRRWSVRHSVRYGQDAGAGEGMPASYLVETTEDLGSVEPNRLDCGLDRSMYR